nr:MAG TPA: hypothetical protein [Caudoviricetes sp.]
MISPFNTFRCSLFSGSFLSFSSSINSTFNSFSSHDFTFQTV